MKITDHFTASVHLNLLDIHIMRKCTMFDLRKNVIQR